MTDGDRQGYPVTEALAALILAALFGVLVGADTVALSRAAHGGAVSRGSPSRR